MVPCGHIEDIPEEPKKYSDNGHPDLTPDSDPDPDLDPNPDPEPKSNHEPESNEGNLINSLSEAIKSLAKSVHKDPSKSKPKIRDPNMFDGSDSKKLRGFCYSVNSTSSPSPSPSKPNSQRSTTLCPS